MKLLLDTHALLWFVENNSRLSQQALSVLSDPANDLLLSPATFWELAIKVSLGKYQIADTLGVYIHEAIRLYRLNILPIEVDHAAAVATLPLHHRDPFDRLLIAQAMIEELPIVSADEAFDAYSVMRLW